MKKKWENGQHSRVNRLITANNTASFISDRKSYLIPCFSTKGIERAVSKMKRFNIFVYGALVQPAAWLERI